MKAITLVLLSAFAGSAAHAASLIGSSVTGCITVAGDCTNANLLDNIPSATVIVGPGVEWFFDQNNPALSIDIADSGIAISITNNDLPGTLVNVFIRFTGLQFRESGTIVPGAITGVSFAQDGLNLAPGLSFAPQSVTYIGDLVLPTGASTTILNLAFAPVPEPATFGLMAAGLAACVVVTRRNKRVAS